MFYFIEYDFFFVGFPPQPSQKKKKLEASCRYCLFHYPWIFIIWFDGDSIWWKFRWDWFGIGSFYFFLRLMFLIWLINVFMVFLFWYFFSWNYCCLAVCIFQFLEGQLFSIPQYVKYFFDFFAITHIHFSNEVCIYYIPFVR